MPETSEVIKFSLGDIIAYVTLLVVIVAAACGALMENKNVKRNNKGTKNPDR